LCGSLDGVNELTVHRLVCGKPTEVNAPVGGELASRQSLATRQRNQSGHGRSSFKMPRNQAASFGWSQIHHKMMTVFGVAVEPQNARHRETDGVSKLTAYSWIHG
jgi:hypothetical protein